MSLTHVFQERLKAFITNDDGTTSFEYGLLAAGMAMALISAFSNISDAIQQGFQSIGMLVNPPIAAGKSGS